MSSNNVMLRIGAAESIGAPLGPYSHGIAVGGFLHLAGQVAVDVDGNLVGEKDFEAQVQQAYRNVEAVLKAAGTDFSRVVKMTVYLTDMKNLSTASRVRQEFCPPGQFPASTVVQISQLADPRWLIEVEAVAYLGELEEPGDE